MRLSSEKRKIISVLKLGHFTENGIIYNIMCKATIIKSNYRNYLSA